MPKRKKRNRMYEREWKESNVTGLSDFDKWHQAESRKKSSGPRKRSSGLGWFPSKKRWKVGIPILPGSELASQFEKKAEAIKQKSRSADEKRFQDRLWGSLEKDVEHPTFHLRGLYPYEGKVSPFAKKKAGVYKAYADTLRTRRKKPFKVDTSGNIKGKI